jgi:hypothetical protein
LAAFVSNSVSTAAPWQRQLAAKAAVTWNRPLAPACWKNTAIAMPKVIMHIHQQHRRQSIHTIHAARKKKGKMLICTSTINSQNFKIHLIFRNYLTGFIELNTNKKQSRC